MPNVLPHRTGSSAGERPPMTSCLKKSPALAASRNLRLSHCLSPLTVSSCPRQTLRTSCLCPVTSLSPPLLSYTYLFKRLGCSFITAKKCAFYSPTVTKYEDIILICSVCTGDAAVVRGCRVHMHNKIQGYTQMCSI